MAFPASRFDLLDALGYTAGRPGVWRSRQARCVWDAEVVGSSPTTPTLPVMPPWLPLIDRHLLVMIGYFH